MADNIKLTTVTAAIAALTIPVTNARGGAVNLIIRDIGALKTAVNPQDCPALQPRPNNFVTNVSWTRDTQGSDAAYKTINYSLTYIFFFAPVAEGLDILASYGDMVTQAMVVATYLVSHTNLITGQTNFLPESIGTFDPVADATGTLFHGCELSFRVSQYLET